MCAGRGTPFEVVARMLRSTAAAFFTLLLLTAASAAADWSHVAPGVDYQEYTSPGVDIHVTRIDLSNRELRVVAGDESARGTKVSDFARKAHAIAAINGDYFDERFNPIGLTVGPCGEWESAKRTKREGYVAIGGGNARIARQSEVDRDDHAEEWMTATVSGWPALVVDCTPLSPSQLPGSDAFTRAPHPRTAVGLTRDGKTLYFVVADGRRAGIPGLTLAQLAKFFTETLQACSAINFDGGGSSTMWVGDHVVNRPSDGVERRVASQLAVIDRDDDAGCSADRTMASSAVTSSTLATTARTITTRKTTTVTTSGPAAPPTEPPADTVPPPRH